MVMFAHFVLVELQNFCKLIGTTSHSDFVSQVYEEFFDSITVSIFMQGPRAFVVSLEDIYLCQ